MARINPNRVYMGKYRCSRCSAFCGLIFEDSLPEAPPCEDDDCPAIKSLMKPVPVKPEIPVLKPGMTAAQLMGLLDT